MATDLLVWIATFAVYIVINGYISRFVGYGFSNIKRSESVTPEIEGFVGICPTCGTENLCGIHDGMEHTLATCHHCKTPFDAYRPDAIEPVLT
jgi:hypothetical protein